MAKKQIAIVTRHMITGGVERALIAMLKQFNYEEVAIDLYVEHLGGGLFHEVPKEVTINEIPTVRKKDILKHPCAIIKKVFYIFKLRWKKWPYIQECFYSSKLLLPVKKYYDIAISYHAPNTVPVFYVIDKIKAGKKILWLHGTMEANAGNTFLAKRYHACYDKVFGVSLNVQESFLKLHPDMRKQTEIFYNFVDVEGIREKAKKGPTFSDDFNGVRLLTIGRLDHQKGIDIAVRVCHLLKERGFHFRWYVCGEGDQREILENLINEMELEDYFILLGNQSNPYGYLKDCNLYIQPSRSEGYCTTTNEARILYKPVITTEVSGAREQFENGVTGWVVNNKEEAIFQKVGEILENMEECNQIVRNLQCADLFTTSNVERIFS